MDADTIKLAIELADRVTTIGFMLIAIVWLTKENAALKALLFEDWKRQRDNEHEEVEKSLIRKEITGTSL